MKDAIIEAVARLAAFWSMMALFVWVVYELLALDELRP